MSEWSAWQQTSVTDGWSGWQQAFVTGLSMPAPSRMTVIAHRGALSSTAPTSGVRTAADTEAQYWIAEASWENLDARQWGEVMGALLDGRTVELPIPMERLGTPFGSPQLDGAQDGETVQTIGWTEDTEGLLLPGEYVQIGDRLHHVQESVDSDSSGAAEMVVWPPVEAEDNAQIAYAAPAGRWVVEGDVDSRQRAPSIYTVRVGLVEER